MTGRGLRNRSAQSILLSGLLALGALASHGSDPSISDEWKQRLTESLRTHVAQRAENPFRSEIASSTPSTVQSATPTVTDLPILSSLSQLLTQAATETVTFSQEFRPSFDWSQRFWSLRNPEEWSWRKRFDWFQNEGSPSMEGDSTNEDGAGNPASNDGPENATPSSEESP